MRVVIDDIDRGIRLEHGDIALDSGDEAQAEAVIVPSDGGAGLADAPSPGWCKSRGAIGWSCFAPPGTVAG